MTGLDSVHGHTGHRRLNIFQIYGDKYGMNTAKHLFFRSIIVGTLISLFSLSFAAPALQTRTGVEHAVPSRACFQNLVQALHGLTAESASKSGFRISKPVPGLYESIPTKDLNLQNVKIETKMEGGPNEFETTVRLYSVKTIAGIKVWSKKVGSGRFRRGVTDGATLFLRSAELDLPSNISRFVNVPGVTPLIPGRGIPIQAYVTFIQMKKAGIKYGQLRTVLSNITNKRTLKELAEKESIRDWMARYPNQAVPGDLITKELLGTHTGQYIATILTQSGHKIVKAEADPINAALPGIRPFSLRIELAPWN